MITHSTETLAALDACALRALYTETTGAKPGRRSRDTLITAILEAQVTATAAETETATDPEPDPEPAPIAEPARVRLTGYGAYEGSEMTCPLFAVTPVAAEVQVVDARIRFNLEDGRIAHRRKGWDETGWRLDLASLPARDGFTDEEVNTMPLKDLGVDQLRALYERTLQRTTGSVDRRYLVWKVREARKGNIKVGPAERRTSPDAEMKVVPLRMEETVVEALDEAWGRHGYKNRVAFIRAALARLLREYGEEEAASQVE